MTALEMDTAATPVTVEVVYQAVTAPGVEHQIAVVVRVAQTVTVLGVGHQIAAVFVLVGVVQTVTALGVEH